MSGIAAVVFAVVMIGLIVAVRRQHDDDGATSTAGRWWLLGGGVAMPVIVIAVVLLATVFSMSALSNDVDDTDLTIEVIGHRWWWEVRYPDGEVVTANEIHIPANRRVGLKLRSADVIHSFWVPSLAGKMDLIPERENTLVIEAGSSGRFAGHCAEFCGIQHANMRLTVVAHDDDGFADWLASQRRPAAMPATDPARRGREVFTRVDCGGCHTIAGTDALGTEGPDLTHLASRSTIGAGVTDMTVPDLRAWVTDPHAIKDGVLMPALDLEPDEIDALVAYLAGLR